MKRILVMDEKNYSTDLDEIYRVAVRGIIFIDGKLLMIENDFGEVKLPGGGIDSGEDDCKALVREVKEETGYDVILESIVPFGEIEEKRLSVREPMIWHQISRLYFCDVYPEKGLCDYTENEKKHGFKQVLYSLDEAIEKNGAMLEKEGKQAWNQREYKTLLLIQDYLQKQENTFGTPEHKYFETERLIVREWLLDDIVGLLKIMLDVRVHIYTKDKNNPWDIQRTEKYIQFMIEKGFKTLDNYHGAVIEKKTNQIVEL